MDRRLDAPQRRGLSHWHWLLLIPYPAVLWVPFYNMRDPVILGFPFFYAYQMIFVVITALLTAFVYWTTRTR